MTLSVALCTYNGAAYLDEQLDSIAQQSRPPDELILCDDGSQDGTIQLAEDWASRSPFPVMIYSGDRNIGAIKNFERAIGSCRGDIIALADQDDVWRQDKLACTEEIFTSAPHVGLVFTDANVVDETLSPLGYTMWKTRRFGRPERRLMSRGRATDVLIRRNVVTGATMAFRSRYKELVLPMPDNRVHLHDGWIAYLIAAVSDIAFIEEPLVQYRQRPGQHTGAHPPTGVKMLMHQAAKNRWSTNLDAQVATIEWFILLRLRLVTLRASFPCADTIFDQLDAKIEHCQARLTMPETRVLRAPFVLRELVSLHYHRYSIGVWAAAKDLTAFSGE